ncbi:MAG: hypothetical protein ACKKL5_00475 [Candidatus Komeilibacteria bacterium]
MRVLILSDYLPCNRYWVDRILANLPRPPFQPLYSNNIDSVRKWLAEDPAQFQAVLINPDQGQWPTGVNWAVELSRLVNPDLIWLVSQRNFQTHELQPSQGAGFHCKTLTQGWSELRQLLDSG